ncbi:aquaporin-like protein [Dichomitus squalens]|uniref:Aquaporin-like protein n=1 Tax=Dichomitus squalens TaxID=114155 RepID=A0A4Q9PI35_9APHY|nr:aquaporin-like protein [Dichomitus squalens]
MLRSRLSRERDFIHLADVKPRLNAQIVWERRRRRNVHWLAECAAEFVGTFIYIGIGYAIGVVLAFVVTQPTSGGHYNPGVSIAFAIMRRISPQKALRYIVAQILGAYCACLLIYVQYGDAIKQVEAELSAAGTLASTLFTPSGPAGVFAIYLAPGTSFGRVFLNEFVCDFVIGLVIWAVDDPSNHTVSPVAAPWIIAFVFALMVWSYSSVGGEYIVSAKNHADALPLLTQPWIDSSHVSVATNTARDLGARLMAITIWGLEAGGGPYAAITALTNILATSLAAVFYELVFADYSRVLTPASADLLAAQVAYNEHASRTVAVTELERDVSPDDKAIEQTLERV